METSTEIDYSSSQKAVGELFYIFMVISCIGIVVGCIWSILDFVMPSGKFDLFLALNLGYQITIVAGFLAALFILLIIFFGLFKKGAKGVLRFLFKERELEERYKNRLDVKIAAGGLLLSIMAVMVGLIFAIVQDFYGSGSSPLASIVAGFSAGNWVLAGSLAFLALVGLTLFLIFFWKNGNYAIYKIIGTLEKE
jgi:preprotein translocase subunit SecY